MPIEYLARSASSLNLPRISPLIALSAAEVAPDDADGADSRDDVFPSNMEVQADNASIMIRIRKMRMGIDCTGPQATNPVASLALQSRHPAFIMCASSSGRGRRRSPPEMLSDKKINNPPGENE